jgi:hypothetical protein
MTSLDLTRAFKARSSMPNRMEVATSKAIRAKCLECSANSWREVQLCQVFDCPLWLCRFGRRPATVMRDTPEWLDPVHAAIEAHKQGLRELGQSEWIHPLTGTPESLCIQAEPTLIAFCSDVVDGTSFQSS